jgi:hypothetical protein
MSIIRLTSERPPAENRCGTPSPIHTIEILNKNFFWHLKKNYEIIAEGKICTHPSKVV